jgi:hypothetical protein
VSQTIERQRIQVTGRVPTAVTLSFTLSDNFFIETDYAPASANAHAKEPDP